MVDSTGAQIARLEHYMAWARAERNRLEGAGEHPGRQVVLLENIEGARVVLERILVERATLRRTMVSSEYDPDPYRDG